MMRHRAALLIQSTWTSRRRRSAALHPTLRSYFGELTTGERFSTALVGSISTGTMESPWATSTAMALTIFTFANRQDFPTASIETAGTELSRTSQTHLELGSSRIQHVRFLPTTTTTAGRT